jgi:hypothetical protein
MAVRHAGRSSEHGHCVTPVASGTADISISGSCGVSYHHDCQSQRGHIMRLILAAIAALVLFGLAEPVGATAPAARTTTNATPVDGIVLAQRCRCVERRWNGSCKLRVCRDKW